MPAWSGYQSADLVFAVAGVEPIHNTMERNQAPEGGGGESTLMTRMCFLSKLKIQSGGLYWDAVDGAVEPAGIGNSSGMMIKGNTAAYGPLLM